MKEIRKKEEVERFLKQFLPKLDIWGIIYIDREKNDAALKAMGITPNARETVIRSIETDDYVETITDIVSWVTCGCSERMLLTRKYTSR